MSTAQPPRAGSQTENGGNGKEEAKGEVGTAKEEEEEREDRGPSNCTESGSRGAATKGSRRELPAWGRQAISSFVSNFVATRLQ